VAQIAMTGTYPDGNEDVTFWSDVRSLSRGHYCPEEEEMALLTADKHSSAHKTSLSSDMSSAQSSALVKWESPGRRRSSYNFNEVAINLQNTAEKALEDSTSNSGSKQILISRSVARIVLEDSNNVLESSKEYIAGVVRKVARFAQDAGHGESSGSAANQVIQPEVSLGNLILLCICQEVDSWSVFLATEQKRSSDYGLGHVKLEPCYEK